MRHSTLAARFQRTLVLSLVPIALVAVSSFVMLRVTVGSFADAASQQSEEVAPLTRLGARIRSAEDTAYEVYLGRQPLSTFNRSVAPIERELGRVAERIDNADAQRAIEAATAHLTRSRVRLRLLVEREASVTDPEGDSMRAVSASINGAAEAMERAQALALAETIETLVRARDVRRQSEWAAAALALLALLAAVAVGRRLARSVLGPIRRLEEGARLLGDGELGHRVEVETGDELGELSASFNAMAAALERGERDLIESQRRAVQAQKMEAVGQLAGGIAHDFNNLLLVIRGYAEFLRDSMGADDIRRTDAEEIGKAAERASALTRQLLTLSRRELARPEVFSANALLEGIDALLRRSIMESCTLELVLDPELPATEMDRPQLEQAILNLALNGRDAMPLGGTLRIETRRRVVSAGEPVEGLTPGTYVEIAVSDTGVGMSTDVRDRAFEPFFTTKPRGSGTGLGLPTVHGIVTGSGGAVTIESEEGLGTTISLYVPAIDEHPRETSAPGPSREAAGRDEVVLVAEDEETIRTLIERLLTLSGYRPIVAGSGAEALALAEGAGRIDLLLTDVVMPGMTGRELANELVEARPDLPVVFMSGYSDTIVSAHGALAPGTRYLSKPFARQELLTVLEDALRSADAAAA
jgi:signal transduction histidine kinase/ActR/RegA family two-component response regulator